MISGAIVTVTHFYAPAAPSNFLCWCSQWTCGAWAWSSTICSLEVVFPLEIQNASIPGTTGEECIVGSSSSQSGAACRVTPRYCKQINRYVKRKLYCHRHSVLLKLGEETRGFKVIYLLMNRKTAVLRWEVRTSSSQSKVCWPLVGQPRISGTVSRKMKPCAKPFLCWPTP